MAKVKARSPWSDLLPELLESIVSCLPLSDHPYFASVCKSWSQVITSPIYPADRSPLLVHYKKWGDGICRYYSPSLNKTFIVDCPFDLSDTRFYFTRDGWLLLYKEFEVILANPFTGILHKFPGLPYNNFTGIAFSGTPPNDCMIFAIDSIVENYVVISIWDSEDWDSDMQYDNNLPFILAQYSNPVFCGGVFYCLGMEGNLGVYDPVEDTWTVLAYPKQFRVSYKESYLVEYEGELLAVLIGKHNPPVQVLWLNQARMAWERVENLGTHTLFAGSQMSLLTSTSLRKMENKVYHPRIHGVPETIQAEVKCSDGRMFFVPKSLSSHKPREGTKRTSEDGGICYYSLQNGKRSKYYGSKEFVYCIWYEPRFLEN